MTEMQKRFGAVRTMRRASGSCGLAMRGFNGSERDGGDSMAWRAQRPECKAEPIRNWRFLASGASARCRKGIRL